VLHPFRWAPLYLRALKITIIESAPLPMPEIFPHPLGYLELIGGLLTSVGPGYYSGDARIRMLIFIVMSASQLDLRYGRESVQPFIHAVIHYLTKYVLHRTNRTSIWSCLE